MGKKYQIVTNTRKPQREFERYKNEKAPTTFVIEASLLKGGGYLLSRIALQYHRRKWA